jgi:hypothetical protein
MYEKRATLLMNVNTTLPLYDAHKELNLARAQMKRAHLEEKCQVILLILRVTKFSMM